MYLHLLLKDFGIVLGHLLLLWGKPVLIVYIMLCIHFLQPTILDGAALIFAY
jgi:hypothetical protein